MSVLKNFATSTINVAGNTLSNVNNVVATRVTTPTISSTTQSVGFDYKQVIDVDSLIVRSNITVLLPGLNTYTNLPTDLVRLDPDTGRILDQYINNAFIRLMEGCNYINPNLLPPIETSRKTLLHTKDRVGVGLLNPQQKLHVHGTQCITSGRLGIGTPFPSSVLHVFDNNGPGPTVRIEQQGTVDIMQVIGSNSRPLLYVNANNTVGIGTSTTLPAYALTVQGTAYTTGGVRTDSLESPSGTIDCRLNTLSNVFSLYVRDAYFTNSANFTNDVITPAVTTNAINSTQPSVTFGSAIRIVGFDTSLYTGTEQVVLGIPDDAAKIGLRVNNNIMGKGFLSISDRRIKRDITPSPTSSDLQKVLGISVYDYRLRDGNDSEPAVKGFIAQEVEEVAPFAVKTTVSAIPSVLRRPTSVSNDRKSLEFATPHDIAPGMFIRILVGDRDDLSRVIESVSPTTITLSEALPENAAPHNTLVYGEIVRDFKLLDSERMLPMVYGAIKELHGIIAYQQSVINNILDRLGKINA